MKIKGLMNKLPVEPTNPLKWLTEALSNWDSYNHIEEFSFREVTLLETIQYISKLGSSTSCGSDGIDALSLKVVTSQLAPPIRHMVNISLKSSSFANKWKFAKLLPLLKDKSYGQVKSGVLQTHRDFTHGVQIGRKSCPVPTNDLPGDQQVPGCQLPCLQKGSQYHHLHPGHHGQGLPGCR